MADEVHVKTYKDDKGNDVLYSDEKILGIPYDRKYYCE